MKNIENQPQLVEYFTEPNSDINNISLAELAHMMGLYSNEVSIRPIISIKNFFDNPLGGFTKNDVMLYMNRIFYGELYDVATLKMSSESIMYPDMLELIDVYSLASTDLCLVMDNYDWARSIPYNVKTIERPIIGIIKDMIGEVTVSLNLTDISTKLTIISESIYLDSKELDCEIKISDDRYYLPNDWMIPSAISRVVSIHGNLTNKNVQEILDKYFIKDEQVDNPLKLKPMLRDMQPTFKMNTMYRRLQECLKET